MIQDYVPRRFGLDTVVPQILKSKVPLRDVAQQNVFLPPEILHFFGNRFENARELLANLGGTTENGSPTTPRIALERIAAGGDYLEVDDGVLRDAFPNGDQDYHYVDVEANAFNPSFSLVLFPKETVSVRDKTEMLQDFTYPPWYNPGKYEHVKSIVLSDGKAYYMVTLRGDERIDMKKMERILGVKKKKIKFVPSDEVEDLVGRSVGAVSPLIHESCYENIHAIWITKELMRTGYSQPHYNLVLDKRSALVISDMNDVVNILNGTPYFPQVMQFHNEHHSLT